MTKKLLIEGWRGINHSYAMVNQYQLLEFKKLDVDLYHNDVPFYRKDWNQVRNFCGFDQVAVEQINAIPNLGQGIRPDITYRIGFPYNLMPANSEKLFVYGTSEYQMLTDEMLSLGKGPTDLKSLPLTIITPSNWSKIGFLNAGFKDDQVRVVPHGVDLSIFKQLDPDLRVRYRGLLGVEKDSFVMLSIGAMSKNKGIDILLSAYIQLKRKYPQLKLALKDQSNLYGFSANDLVMLYCKERNIDPTSKEMQDAISGIVCIAENLSLNQLNGLYNAADCYVSPYRAEGFNLPPLEAAAAGTPIIVTKGGATDDYADGSFALQIHSVKKIIGNQHFLEPNLESLIDNLEKLLTHKALSMNKRGASTFLSSNLSWEVVCGKLTCQMGI